MIIEHETMRQLFELDIEPRQHQLILMAMLALANFQLQIDESREARTAQALERLSFVCTLDVDYLDLDRLHDPSEPNDSDGS